MARTHYSDATTWYAHFRKKIPAKYMTAKGDAEFWRRWETEPEFQHEWNDVVAYSNGNKRFSDAISDAEAKGYELYSEDTQLHDNGKDKRAPHKQSWWNDADYNDDEREYWRKKWNDYHNSEYKKDKKAGYRFRKY